MKILLDPAVGGAAGGTATVPPPAVPPPAAPPAGTAAAPPPAAPPPAAEPKPIEKTDLKIPEGKSVDPASLDTLLAFSKAQGLSKAQVQAILDRDLTDRETQTAGWHKAMKDQDAAWVAELKAHKEFGGAKFAESSEDAKRALDYADPDGSFRKDLEAAQLANNPKLVMAFAKLGKLLKDDKLSIQTAANPKGKSVEEKLYPSMAAKR